MGILEEFVVDRMQAINLSIAKSCATGDPLIEVDDELGVGQLKSVSIRKGTTVVVMAQDRYLIVPARKVYLFSDADVAD